MKTGRFVAALGDLHQDLRYAGRSLRKSRGYAAAAILTLALGIGATTAIFTVVNSLMLRSLPVHDPDRLVSVREDDPQRPNPFLDTFFFDQIQQRPELFEKVCAWMPGRFNLAERGQADYVQGIWATGGFFETLGVPAVLGRTFTPADDRTGGGPDGPVAVIGDGYWQRRFGGAADVLGRRLTLDRMAYTIVGVTPPEFSGPMVGRSFDVLAGWLPARRAARIDPAVVLRNE